MIEMWCKDRRIDTVTCILMNSDCEKRRVRQWMEEF